MKIGIDARLFGTKHAGLGRYTEQVIKHLEKIDSQNEYFIFLQKDGFETYQPQNSNFKKVLADFRAYSWQEHLIYPGLLKKYNLDFVHFTHFSVPFFYRKKFIVTIHDLIISHYPSSRATTLNPLLYKIKLFFYRIIVQSAANRAQKIIAVSEATKDDIVKLLKTKSEKVEVVYEGVDLPVLNGNESSIISKLAIGSQFLLYVGAAYPHKNLEKLIEAFRLIKKDFPFLQLVLVGKDNFFYKRLKEWTKDTSQDKPFVTPEGTLVNYEQSIVFTGYLNDSDLARLYQKASLYVFPSLIEGFGLPPMEAQNYGLPVASSNNACLKETLGDSAEFFDPQDINNMANVIISLLNNPERQNELRQKGFKNLKRYSWQKCAEQILNTYLSFK